MRGRATAVVTSVTVAVLGLCVTALVSVVQHSLYDGASRVAGEQVEIVAAQITQEGAPTGPLIGCPGVMVSTTAPPPSEATVLSMAVVRTATGPYFVTSAPDLRSAEAALTTMTWLLVPGIGIILLAMAGLTWFAMGRALRPVEAIRAEFAEITSHDLHRRVPDPRTGDEVSRLANTMNRTLHQLQRAVERLRTFTADASHELRAPLTTLLMRLELAVSRPGGTDWPDIARESLRDAENLKNIVEDLLMLARLDSGPSPGRERIVVSDLMRQADLTRHVSPELSAGRQLIVEDTAPGAEVYGSRGALSRLLANLITNAARHARSTVRVRSTGEPGWVTIEVTDDGPGIPEADRRRVFDRFTRLTDARTPGQADSGTGLGLAIAHDIALAHGGSLVAESPAPGEHGARLVVHLPTYEP
ncbi:signal transduction histidine kinase [Pseudosporangium ferrugineum]|uniref:histidine kinase n=1 Tax=Pseudosporangium ferrugineum TaxID=439699 RepID=A0A2T0REM2_9ACTN|nr:signal transduction histidine kinase [Pseudosporangium ferrugineum]